MPVVDLPDGREVEFPEGMSRDDMNRAIQAFLTRDTAGPLAELVTGAGRATPQTEELPELSQSGLLAGEDKATIAKVIPALATATDSNEIVKIVTENFPNVGTAFNLDAQGNTFPILVNNVTGQRAQINRPGLSGLDILQGVAIGGALTPATRAGSLLGATAGAGATSAAIQASQAAVGGEFSLPDVGLDLAGGAAGRALEGAGVGARRLAQGDAAADSTLQAAQQLDIPVLTADVLPPETFAGRTLSELGEKIPPIAGLGTGGLRKEQQRARAVAVDRVVEQYGEFSETAIVDSLKSRASKVKQAAGNVLEATGGALDGLGEPPLSNTRSAVEAARRELGRPEVIQTSDAAGDLDTLMAALENPQTFTTLRENRTAFREIKDRVDPTGRSQLPSRAKALLTRVDNAIREDMEAFARQNLSKTEFDKWKRANAVYASEAKALTKTRLKNVLDRGDTTPEAVNNMLFSRNRSEVQQLQRSLTPEGRQNARAAIISRISEKARNRVGGLTPNSFLTELRRHEMVVDTFFKGEEKKALTGLRRVLERTTRAQEARVTTATGQTVLGALGAGGLFFDPATTLGAAATVGLLSRLYAAPAVRNALLRVATAPASRIDQDIRNFQSVLTAAVGGVSRADSTPAQPE